jgi:Domain of unknown function (DUF1990)
VAADRHPGSPRARRALAALAGKGLNFDPDQAEHFTTANGWKVDDYPQPLPPEPPGPPRPGGSFEVAQRLLRDYAFADPAIVRAVYATDSPFERRDMLLEGRFWGLRFHFGVRVGGLVDEELVTDGRRLRRWGWNYRTLQGHLEMGQMDYQVRSGSTAARSSSASTPSPARPTSPTRSSGSASGCSAGGSSAASPGMPASAWPG